MEPVRLAQQLIRCGSDTSQSNAECSALLQQLLSERGFEVAWHDYRDLRGCPKVTLSACRASPVNSSRPGIAFFSHNDVVSSDGWRTVHASGPLEALVADQRVWGRGACDMKGPIASLLSAIDSVEQSRQRGNLYVFITGDEECGMVGAELLVKHCPVFRQVVDLGCAGIITEPTQLRVVARHKGGCRFRVISHGIAAHSSTADGWNANWQLIPWLNTLKHLQQRTLNDPNLRNESFDPPTLSLNVILRNQPAEFNITVSQAQCEVFMRIMPETQWQALVEEMMNTARDLQLEVSSLSVLPPLATSPDCLLVREALHIVQQASPESVGYATDGSRYTEIPNLIVLGPGSIEQAHRCDEWISVEQLQQGANIYRQLIERFAIGS
jgi:acetylornithine deacetylase